MSLYPALTAVSSPALAMGLCVAMIDLHRLGDGDVTV